MKCGITDEVGLLRLDPTEVTFYGGSSRGSVTLDLRGSSQRVRVVQAASRIDLTQVFPIQIFFGKAGPFAPLLTKGADFSRLRSFGQMGHGKSEIRRVVSDWQIVNGIAKTKDVAFTTPKNTVAFRGDLNLLNGRYQNFFVATVDQQGCTQVKQQITGPFAHPDAEGPASTGLGAFKSAFRKVKKLFQSL